MKIQVTGEQPTDRIDVTGGASSTVIDVTAGLVWSVNGRTGSVVGLAEADQVEDIAQAAVAEHVAADDPHADRAWADSALQAHVLAADPHGDRAAATAALTAHTVAVDPHGDRAYADNLVSVDWINPTKSPYGADSAGAVDATTAIQAAINALGSRGGTVYLPPGDFLLNGPSPVNLPAPITLQGAGHGATTLRIGSSFAGTSAITVSSDDCMIQGLQIRGASSTTTSNPACHGVTATGVQEFRVFNTTFQWINGYAIRAFGTAATTLHGTQVDMIKVQSCAGGIHIKSDPAAMAANVMLSNVFTRFLGVNSGPNANLDGIRIEDSWDVLAQNVLPWMQATQGGTGAAFRVTGNCAAIFVQNLDALGPQTGTANVIIESGPNGDPQNIQIQGGVIQQGLIGILIAGAANQVRVRTMRILNNQTHNIAVTSSGFGIYFDECLMSLGGQGATGTNYDVDWTGGADGFITDCRFGSAVVTAGTAGVQGVINITSAVVRVLNANFAGTGSASTNWYPDIAPQFATRVDGTNYEARGNVDMQFAAGQRLSLRPNASSNNTIAINVLGTDVNDRYRLLGDGTSQYGIGSSARDTTWGRQGAAQIGTPDSDIVIGLAGKGLRVKEGSNAKMGTTTLNGTTDVTVSTTAVASNSRIFLTIQALGGTAGAPYVRTRTAGTSFTIRSTNASDTSTVAWMIVDPA
ncbi:glycosyl hydrolase family 28-related protein [Streptomyces sp. CC224B]|uniref:glycosyl hydrolase family 28-related protein n=1 Tax=Streptomyces sp. CC224B TaxID=3044571 RepID=UPI0024A83C2F|nr:glycosyl hydrolase family 28-related protein [Streptomyces sp. CC224B]